MYSSMWEIIHIFTQISGDVFRTRVHVRTRENSKYPAIEMGLRLRGGGTQFTFSVQLLMLGNVNLKCFLQVATFFIGFLKLDIKMMYYIWNIKHVLCS